MTTDDKGTEIEPPELDVRAGRLTRAGPAAPLDAETLSVLRRFVAEADLVGRGVVMTDLDGTAVLEREGCVLVPDEVSHALAALHRRGCPVALNTLRFPLNVVRTFGRAWSAISAAPMPLVSLNGAVIGHLVDRGGEEMSFEEIAAYPLQAEDIEGALGHVERLAGGGFRDLALFRYPRDWTKGEIIWTPSEAAVAPLADRYRSASLVESTPLPALRAALTGEDILMLLMLVNADENRLMTYQIANRASFITNPGVDKRTGALEAARLLGFDLAQGVGAGDTPVDAFLSETGLAIHVGPLGIPHPGRRATVKAADALGFGAVLAGLREALDGR